MGKKTRVKMILYIASWVLMCSFLLVMYLSFLIEIENFLICAIILTLFFFGSVLYFLAGEVRIHYQSRWLAIPARKRLLIGLPIFLVLCAPIIILIAVTRNKGTIFAYNWFIIGILIIGFMNLLLEYRSRTFKRAFGKKREREMD